MKKIVLSGSLFVALFFFAANLNAQYCGNSAPSICTPGGPYPALGFYPPYDSTPCVQIGTPFLHVVDMQIPATVFYLGAPRQLNWVKVNSVNNLPCGLCWSTNVANNTFNGNSTNCIRIIGTSYDAPGQYKLSINIDANATVGFPITLTNQDAEAFGVKFWARIENLDGTCITVDTLATGNTAHTVGSPAAISLSGNTSVCTGGSSTFSITNAGSYYGYKWSTGAATSSISVSTGGTYTVTAYAACASVTASRTLTVNSNPAPTIIEGGPTTFCSGGSVSLDAGAGYSSYAWSTGASSQFINPSQSGNYWCTVTQNGCTGTSNTVTVTVNTNPSPTITPLSSTTFCDGGSVTLDAGVGYSGYTWSTAETTQTINAAQSGNYTVTVTQNGCTGSSSAITVTENNNPTPTVTANGTTTFCAGGSVTLDAGAGYSSYLWTGGGTGQILNVTSSGSYNCTVTQNGCSGTSNSIVVTVNSLPTPTISAWSPTSFCIGGDVWLDAGAGYSAYLWSTGETVQGITVTQSGDYTCTVTQNGCTGGSNLITVTVTDPTPTINANGPTTFCTGGSVELDAGPGFASYVWSDGATTQTNTVTQSGSYDVTTTLNGCSGISSPVVVTVTSNNLAPVITANPSFDICPGGTATLDAGTGYDTYSWSTSSTSQTITESTAATYSVTVTQGVCSGTASAALNVGNFQIAVSITPAGPVSACSGDVIVLDAGGTYDTYAWSNNATDSSISVTITGSYILTVTSNSCVGIDTVDVTFNSVLQPAISPSSPINACTGDVLTLDAGAGFGSYSWSNSGQTQTIQPISSGSYSVTVTQNGCSGSDTVDITFSAHPVVSISPAGPISVCEGTPVTLDAGSGYSSYSWSNSDQTQTTQPVSSGSYTVTVMQNGCDGTDSVSVTFNALPQPAITPAGPVNACAGDNVILEAGNGYTTYTWSNGDLIQTTQPTATGSYIVEVTQNGCSGTDTVIVTFYTIPHATISPSGNQNLCTGESVTLDAGPGYSSYLWTNGASTQTTSITTTGSNDVTVTQNGCSGASTNPVTVFVNVTPTATISELSTGSGVAILQANPAGATYEWLFQSSPTGPYTVEATTTQTDTVTCGDVGEYHTVVVSQNGCSDTSAQHTVICVGINQLAEEIKFSMMPNPANDILNVSYDLNKTSNVSISIVDLTGRKVMSVLNETQFAGEHRQPVRLNSLASGIYLLNFTTEFGNLNTKFIKE